MLRTRCYGANKSAVDSNTILLLHFDGNLTDSSRNNRTVNSSGTTNSNSILKFGNGSRYFSGNSCLYFNGITISNSDNWTIECWVRLTTLNRANTLFSCGSNCIQLRFNSSNKINIVAATIAELGTGITSVTSNVWYHVALVHSENRLIAYLNGNKEIDVTTSAFSSGTYSYIGRMSENSAENLFGYIDEFRISNIVRWTSSFTPPTKAY